MNEMAKKEKQTYPRTRKEMLRIMRAADKKGQLLEMVLEEFAKHPFPCRHYGIAEIIFLALSGRIM